MAIPPYVRKASRFLSTAGILQSVTSVRVGLHVHVPIGDQIAVGVPHQRFGDLAVMMDNRETNFGALDDYVLLLSSVESCGNSMLRV